MFRFNFFELFYFLGASLIIVPLFISAQYSVRWNTKTESWIYNKESKKRDVHL